MSIIPSTHNLHNYDELGVAYLHRPFGGVDDPRVVLGQLYPELHELLADGTKVLLHGEEVGDRVAGVDRRLHPLGRHGARRPARRSRSSSASPGASSTRSAAASSPSPSTCHRRPDGLGMAAAALRPSLACTSSLALRLGAA